MLEKMEKGLEANKRLGQVDKPPVRNKSRIY